MVSSTGLDRLKFRPYEKVAILVGPNGAGKSTFLRKLAAELRFSRNLAVISNTSNDRFSGMRGVKRISAGRSSHSPNTIVKRAIAETLDGDDSRFYQISKILEHCGYRGRIGFKIQVGNWKYLDPSDLNQTLPFDSSIDVIQSFFSRWDVGEILWVGDRELAHRYSQSQEFAHLLRAEAALRNARYIRGIQVYLQRIDGQIIELLGASSGELALISSLLFLIANRDQDPIVIVDEPENSLHPSWQRQYVDKLLDALEYRDATIVIATHAPLIVTGAAASSRELVSVFQIDKGDAKRLDLADPSGSTESIEEVLWRAFDVVTPASHFVSEQLVGVVTSVERGEIATEDALAVVDRMDDRSFDSKQQAFFGAVRQLITQVAADREDKRRDG